MSCSLAFYFKIAAREKKKNQLQHREIRPENGDADLGSRCIPDPQHGAAGSTGPQGLSGGARGQDAWGRPLWLRECNVGAPEAQASRLPRLLLHIALQVSHWYGGEGPTGAGCYRSVVRGVVQRSPEHYTGSIHSWAFDPYYGIIQAEVRGSYTTTPSRPWGILA